MAYKNANPIPITLRPTYSGLGKLNEYSRTESNRLKDPQLRKLRRQQIVMSRVLGLKNEAIGKVFGLAPNTIAQEIRLAKKDGTLDDLNQRILDDLVPDAIAVYKKKLLDEDDAFVAKDVLKHLDRLTARKDTKEQQEHVQYSMQAYIESKRQLPNGQVVNIEQTLRGEAARAYLEEGRLEEAQSESMAFLSDIVVEKIDE